MQPIMKKEVNWISESSDHKQENSAPNIVTSFLYTLTTLDFLKQEIVKEILNKAISVDNIEKKTYNKAPKPTDFQIDDYVAYMELRQQ